VVTQPSFEPAPFPVAPDLSLVTLEPTDRASSGSHTALLINYEWTNSDLDGHAPLLADLPIMIEVWNDEPNDYTDASFAVAQGPMEPSVTEQEWYAYLVERDAEAARRAKADAERRAREAKERDERYARESKERAERYAREAAEERRRQEEHRALCAKHPDDRACRPPEPVRVVEPRPEPRQVVRYQPPVVQAPRVEAPRPKPPPGPPPVPPVETVPPQPTEYVTWVNGFWRWSGFEWAWLPGWWRIDEAAAQAAARRATVACPLPRAEVRAPPPVPDAVWRPGAWVWGLAAWVWVPGNWHAAVPAR
jgi:hypothetical protein